MAYTYEDFTNAATSAGMLDKFSQYDLEAAAKSPEYGMSLLSLLQDASSASTTEQQLLANEAANQLRKSYGVYSTGDSDSGYSYATSYSSQINDLMDQINNYGSYTYENQDAYQSLLDSIANQQSFSYDLESDPTWSAYKKQYLREGDRASANALAQTAAASGGRTSSYAETAAQQAGNYYAAALTDMIPTLQQNAYSDYLNDFNTRLSSLSALQTDKESDYEQWLNAYSQLQNSLGNYQTQDETDYQRYLDQIGLTYQQEQDALALQQQEFENALAERQLEYDQAYQQTQNALALYQTLGYATPEIAAILGIPEGSTTGTSSGTSSSGTTTTDATGSDGTGTADTDSTGSAASTSTDSGSTSRTLTASEAADLMDGGTDLDMTSVTNLGYGPISMTQLTRLINAGTVELYLENGVIKARKTGSGGAGSSGTTLNGTSSSRPSETILTP